MVPTPAAKIIRPFAIQIDRMAYMRSGLCVYIPIIRNNGVEDEQKLALSSQLSSLRGLGGRIGLGLATLVGVCLLVHCNLFFSHLAVISKLEAMLQHMAGSPTEGAGCIVSWRTGGRKTRILSGGGGSSSKGIALMCLLVLESILNFLDCQV